jgi:N-acetylglucosamine-6-phosphate deacetylase
MSSTVSFTNGRVCYNGELHDRTVHVDLSCGLILGKDAPDMPLEVHDLEGMILAPAYIELQTNGCVGFHFTQYDGSEEYQTHLKRVAEYMVTTGVGSFYATIPTVSEDVFKKVGFYLQLFLCCSRCHFSPYSRSSLVICLLYLCKATQLDGSLGSMS